MSLPLRVWNGTEWVEIGSGLGQVYYQNNQPSTAATGDLWVDSDGTASSLDPADFLSISSASATYVTSDNGTLTNGLLVSPAEDITIEATSASATVNFDVKTQAILYYTGNASANFTMNFRGDSDETLNSIISTGESITASFLVTNGGTAYYPTAFEIDGSSVTPKWSGGSAPTGGNADSIDAYSFTIIKTGDAAFTVLAGAVQFA
jgi:hypothetical protein